MAEKILQIFASSDNTFYPTFLFPWIVALGNFLMMFAQIPNSFFRVIVLWLFFFHFHISLGTQSNCIIYCASHSWHKYFYFGNISNVLCLLWHILAILPKKMKAFTNLLSLQIGTNASFAQCYRKSKGLIYRMNDYIMHSKYTRKKAF